MTSLPLQYIQTRCLTYVQGTYPNLTPIISYLDNYLVNSFYTSVKPFTVYIGGTNFNADGITTIIFGSYKNIPITFFSSTSISFIIPLNAKPGKYMVQVENKNSYGSLFSNKVVFTIE